MRNENHRKVEAVLFAIGKDIAVEDVARLCDLQENRTKKLLDELHTEYLENKESALMLHEKGKFWKFTVKDVYLPLVTSLVQNTELDKSVMETLAVIAWRYPILQADLIKIRHNKAYDHLKMLREREFITKERTGRTYKIRLTPKFFEYFDLPSQDAKEAFKKVIPQEIQEEIQHAEAEIEAKEKEIEKKAENKEKSTAKKKLDKTEEEKAREAADELDNE
jgi:segregation and condensation protein B